MIVFRLYFAGLEQVLDLDFPVRIGSDVCGPMFVGASRLVAPTPRLVVLFSAPSLFARLLLRA